MQHTTTITTITATATATANNNNDNDNNNFEIQTDHLITARRPDLVIVNKKKGGTCQIVDFAVAADHRIKPKEIEKKR